MASGCRKAGLGRDQRGIYIWESLKYLIKPRRFENRAHDFVHASQ
jgi:hypothetical protein